MQPAAKKARVLPFEHLYLQRLPLGSHYLRSYMHRDLILRTIVARDFLLTASADGIIKFWKRLVSEVGASQPTNTTGIVTFIRSFRAHPASISSLCLSPDERYVASLSGDGGLKVFDVKTCDMLATHSLESSPTAMCWVKTDGVSDCQLLISTKSPKLLLLNCLEPDAAPEESSITPSGEVAHLSFIQAQGRVVAVNVDGIISIWNLSDGTEPFSNSDQTHLNDLQGYAALSISVSPNEEFFAIYGADRFLRVFRTRTGRLYRKYDESIAFYQDLSSRGKLSLSSAEFQERLVIEEEIDCMHPMPPQNCIFDESSNFILFPSMLGVKILNLITNKIVRIVGGGEENLRFLHLSLCTADPKSKNLNTLEVASSENSRIDSVVENDVFLAATALKKCRFYLFSLLEGERLSEERDVQNERIITEREPQSEKQTKVKRLPSGAIIRTTLGDIHIELFSDLVPKTVENFAGHSKSGYYDNVLFHRIIKGFMIQTGDPLGDGTGGTSIWGHEFEDEFHPALRHDRPFMISMANAGRNTNGSQFFIATVKTPWLDDKHTVLGRVTKGEDVVSQIEAVATDKLDKPIVDVKIVQIDLIK